MKCKSREKTVSPIPTCLNSPIKNQENTKTKDMAFAHLQKADMMSLANSSEYNGYNESQFSKHYKQVRVSIDRDQNSLFSQADSVSIGKSQRSNYVVSVRSKQENSALKSISPQPSTS